MGNLEQIADYDTFYDEWIAPIEDGAPSSVEKGRRFSTKLITQWLELAEDHELFDCDGPGDGGIDLAVLQKGETDGEDTDGDTWFLVQSKYGTSWVGEETALQEGVKVIRTIAGENKALSSQAQEVVDRLDVFRQKRGKNDQIVLVFAKVDPPTEEEGKMVDRLRKMGQDELGAMFDVQVVSLNTIHKQLGDAAQQQEAAKRLKVSLKGSIASSEGSLHVGVVTLIDFYQFLKSYRSGTQDVGQIYEHNVRQFLGRKSKVNKAIRETLLSDPDQFGLYNNGVTIVVSGFQKSGEGCYDLIEPCIVNGCQTTQSIWDVLDTQLESGGTGVGPDTWRQKARNGVVVVKIVNRGEDASVLNLITRHANSQNAVKDSDFIALEDDFREWQRQLEKKRDLYLEIQRGGWDSRRALQKRHREIRQLEGFAKVSDLLKTYGSGWLSAPGLAFGRNKPFFPGGEIFEKMRSRDGKAFGPDDLYAAYLLQKAGADAGFGRGGRKDMQKASRKQTKFLFAFVAVYLLRDTLQKHKKPHDEFAVSQALIKVLTDASACDQLAQEAAKVIDRYLQDGSKKSLFEEEAYKERFGKDLNTFLKWSDLGRDLSKTPNLDSCIEMRTMYMDEKEDGGHSACEILLNAIDPR